LWLEVFLGCTSTGAGVTTTGWGAGFALAGAGAVAAGGLPGCVLAGGTGFTPMNGTVLATTAIDNMATAATMAIMNKRTRFFAALAGFFISIEITSEIKDMLC
jgi:hypothetical protein